MSRWSIPAVDNNPVDHAAHIAILRGMPASKSYLVVGSNMVDEDLASKFSAMLKKSDEDNDSILGIDSHHLSGHGRSGSSEKYPGLAMSTVGSKDVKESALVVLDVLKRQRLVRTHFRDINKVCGYDINGFDVWRSPDGPTELLLSVGLLRAAFQGGDTTEVILLFQEDAEEIAQDARMLRRLAEIAIPEMIVSVQAYAAV